MHSRMPVRMKAITPKGCMFLPGTTPADICGMIKEASTGKARDILLACYKYMGGMDIRAIACDMIKPYTTVRSWLARMAGRGLDGRFDLKSTGRKKILGEDTLKKITESIPL